jgi:hypothetical protein
MRTRGLLAILIATACALGALAPLTAGGAALSPIPGPSEAPVEWRAIVLKGASMPELDGTEESRLEVLAIHGEHLGPIPFQVDEVLPDGQYALPDGPHPVTDDSPGILDRDDEVAMMLSDFGERAGTAARANLPPGALQIEAADPVTGERRYAYIASVAAPRRSTVSYMRYDPALERIDGASYQMTFLSDFPVGLALRSEEGELSPNLISGTQVRVTARVLMFFTMHFGAYGVKNRVLAWRAGPIRVIRRVSHSVKLIFGIQSPWVVSSEVFYRDYSEDSFVAWVPWVPRLFFGDVRVRTWLDFVGLDSFSLSWSGMEGPPLSIGEPDAKTVARIQRDPPYTRWLVLRGDGKIIIQTFMPSPDFDIVRAQLYYCDGRSASDASDECTGATLRIGYLMTGWQDLSAGTHRLKSVLIVLPADADPHQVASQLATSPAITVSPLSGR